jgi:hypothetical protein
MPRRCSRENRSRSDPRAAFFYHCCGTGGTGGLVVIRVSLPLFAHNLTLWYDIVWDGQEGKRGYSSLPMALRAGGKDVHTNNYD